MANQLRTPAGRIYSESKKVWGGPGFLLLVFSVAFGKASSFRVLSFAICTMGVTTLHGLGFERISLIYACESLRAVTGIE